MPSDARGLTFCWEGYTFIKNRFATEDAILETVGHELFHLLSCTHRVYPTHMNKRLEEDMAAEFGRRLRREGPDWLFRVKGSPVAAASTGK